MKQGCIGDETLFDRNAMSDPTASFLFALTNAGSERALKAEIAAAGRGWRPSFQRRGFVTFKCPVDDEPFTEEALGAAELAFSRRVCLSLGKAESEEAALALAPAGERVHRLLWDGKRLVRTEGEASEPVMGEGIVTLVAFSPEEIWVGFHRHRPGLSPDPGGMAGLEMPPESPSRAWLKLEEAARFFGLHFSREDIAVELGCAPGGVILALLRRGVSVIGVDPARLAPVVMASAVTERPEGPGDPPWVYHCRKPAALVGKRDLGTRVTWFLSDMNQSPAVALKECGRCIRMCPSIRSALITLKLTDLAEAADRDLWFGELRAMGFRSMRLQQLAVHHHEMALLATDRRA